jgi:hypothetical protein
LYLLGLNKLSERGYLMNQNKKEKGSIELIVLGLLGALIVVLAIPLLSGIGQSNQSALSTIKTEMDAAIATPTP